MKHLIKLLAFSSLALALFAVAGTARAGFNENVIASDCSPAFGIAINQGQGLQGSCAAYQQQAYANVGQYVDVRLYYRNTGQQDATSVVAGMTPSASGTFTGFLNSSAGGVNGTAYLTMPSNSYLEFNGAKVYQRQGSDTPVVVKEIRTLAELKSFSLPTIPSYMKCASTGNAFCYQGIVVATFTVKQDAAPVQKCTDPTAQNYNGALPCTYPAQPQICYDQNALNYGGQLPCIPRPVVQICYDTNAQNYGGQLPCIPKPIIPICYDTNALNYGQAGSCIPKPITLTGPSASTLAATSITSSSCRFNSIVNISSTTQTRGYFKYGTSAGNLSFTSAQDTVGTNTGNYQFSDVITGLAPSTTYYYRVVATNQYGTREGEVRSCTTRSNTVVVTTPSAPVTRTVVRQTEVRPIVTTVVPEERIVANSAPSLLFLRIDDRREDLTCSDVVDYQVVYKNVSNIVLEKAILEVQLPAGLVYVKSSSGGTFSATTNTVTFNIGTVLPNQEDVKFIQADVNCLSVDSDMLVANASMSYTNPTTTAQEEAVAYDLDRFFNSTVNGRNLTGAAIFGGAFLPNSLLGWLILVLIILGLIYVIRLFMIPTATRVSKTTKVNPAGTTTTTVTDNREIH